MKYTANYFREGLPDWKKKKDSFLVRILFRPLSFYTASFCANRNISANNVSYFSLIVALIGSCFFLFENSIMYILGAIIMWFWMLLDCTDGNIARCVKKDPMGEFADASSSYVFINVLFFCLGVAAFKNDGLFFAKGTWQILVIGGFTGASDSLARLLYQKFENTKKEQTCVVIKEQSSNETKEKSRIVKIHDRIDKELGQNGVFLPLLLLCSILKCFDLFVMLYAVFFIGTLVLTALVLYRRTKKMEA